MTVGKIGAIRPLPQPGTSRYNDALALIAGMGGSAEAKARMEEIRDARAELDAAMLAYQAIAKEADEKAAKAESAVEALYREQRMLDQRKTTIDETERRLSALSEELAIERRQMDSQRIVDREDAGKRALLIEAREAEAAEKERLASIRDAESRRVNDEARAVMAEAVRVKNLADRRLTRIQELAAGKD